MLAAFRVPKLLKKLAETLFPLECLACGRGGYYCCPSCLSGIPDIGRLTIPPELQAPLFSVWAGFPYGHPVLKALMRDWKFGRKGDEGEGYAEAGRPLAELARRSASKFGPALAALSDIIVPVPLHPRRLRQRGFNQAGILGAALAAGLDRPFVPSGLSRVAYAPPRTIAEDVREASVHGAFAAGQTTVFRGKRVLLVDDVWTTGATLRECAHVLLKGGARSVAAFALASAMKKV